jgi:hypothetical protein
MIQTLGEAFDAGWKLTAYCRKGKIDYGRSSRECQARANLDMEALVWTRGRAFPLSMLDSRLKCPRCGSRRVVIAFQPPAADMRARA